MWTKVRRLAFISEASCLGVLVAFGLAAPVIVWILSLLAPTAVPSTPLRAAAPHPIVAAGEDFTCTATAVWDGDGPIWCEEGPRIRLANIAAREMDGSCRPDHPCPEASGIEARNHLVVLLGGATGRLPTGHITIGPIRLACRSQGWGKGERTAAYCALPDGRDLSTTMVADRFAASWAYRPRQ